MTSKVVSVAGKVRPPNAGKGRVKGVPNKTTVAAREAFQMAFQGLGGATALETWGKDNQTEFYKLFARLIPVQIAGDQGAPIHHVIRLVGVRADER